MTARKVLCTGLQRGPLRDEGIKSVAGHPQSQETFRVVDVSKALMSVMEMVDAGTQVIFDNVGGIDVSRAAHIESGTLPTEFVGRNGAYDANWDILPFQSGGPLGKTVRFWEVMLVEEDDDVAHEQELHVEKGKEHAE